MSFKGWLSLDYELVGNRYLKNVAIIVFNWEKVKVMFGIIVIIGA